jgi:hypothetical protein
MKDWQYGGEQIEVKGHLLVRGAKEAVSRTEWGRRGYKVKEDIDPHSERTNAVGKYCEWVTYEVYREDQVELNAVRNRTPIPPRSISTLAAVWGLTGCPIRADFRKSLG